jgi:tetratricopeptide (TPR) repeat protein
MPGLRPAVSGFGVWSLIFKTRLFLLLLLSTFAARAFSHAQIGDVLDDAEMPTLDGGTNRLLSTNAAVNVFIFFKPGQEYSRVTLKHLAACEQELAGKSVRWVAIVSDRFPAASAAADVKEAGLAMPVLIDKADALYGRLGVALTPVIGITGPDHRLLAYEPFAKVNYTNVLRARIRYLLKEISEQDLDRVLHPLELQDDTEAQAARRWLKLAERFFAATNYDKALENTRASLARDTNFVSAQVLLGRILAAQGKRDQALSAFDRALQLEPTNAAALSGRQAVSP